MRVGPISELVLVGGGTLLRDVVDWAVSVDLPVRVLMAPRHAMEEESGETLVNFLATKKVPSLVVESISENSVPDFVAWNPSVLCLSLGAAWIFRKEHLSAIFGGMILNSHGTRLPQNRGGGGFSWQIMMGNPFGFCVLHEVDSGVDTGNIVAIREFLYPAGARTPNDYELISQQENLSFIAEFVESVRKTERLLAPVPQSEWFSSYWPRLDTEVSGRIDWSLSALELERFICAFDAPYKGASTFLGSRRVFLQSVSLNLVDGYFHPYQSGLVYRKSKDWVCVAARGGSLVIEKITGENGQDLFSEVKVGDRFNTPQNLLEQGLKRIRYNANGLVAEIEE